MSINAEVLRDVLRSVSDTISNLQLQEFTASTPVTGPLMDAVTLIVYHTS